MGIEKKLGKTLLLCLLLVVLLSQEVVTPALCRKTAAGSGLDDQKNYYHTPDPHGGSPPNSHSSSPHKTPPHSSGGRSGSTYYPPAPSHGGGGGGGGSQNPPSPIIITPTPPATPSFDPNTPPFTCDYWRTHPAAIWGIFGYWCDIRQLFGPGAASAFGRNVSLLDALGNTRNDGIGALYREGTASFLNALASKNFVFTSQQVKDALNAAIFSDKAASAQAQTFKKANEGHLKNY